jgi:hypothetical protein
LIDVRDVPLSRKPGFSKSALQANLEAHGIAYVHLKGLGDPKPGREAASGVRRMCDRVQPRAAGYCNRECRQLLRHHRCAAVARCRAGRGQDDLHVQAPAAAQTMERPERPWTRCARQRRRRLQRVRLSLLWIGAQGSRAAFAAHRFSGVDRLPVADDPVARVARAASLTLARSRRFALFAEPLAFDP